MILSNGFEIIDFSDEELEKHKDDFKNLRTGMVKVGPNNLIFPEPYKKWGQKYIDFKFRSTDVVIVTYPKCGSIWMQEIIWTMCHNPNLNHPDSGKDLSTRSPFLEFDTLVAGVQSMTGHHPEMVDTLKKIAPTANPDDGLYLQLAQHSPDRRIIKTHLPFSLLPPDMLDTCKVIYVGRNPKDVALQYLYHCRLVNDFTGSLEKFIEYYCNGGLWYGSYDKHLAEAWQNCKHPNLYTISYEDLKKNNVAQLKSLDKFIETGLTNEQLANVATHTTFAEMKSREMRRRAGSFGSAVAEQKKLIRIASEGDMKEEREYSLDSYSLYRRDKRGSRKTELTPELLQIIDQWTNEKIIANMGFNFNCHD